MHILLLNTKNRKELLDPHRRCFLSVIVRKNLVWQILNLERFGERSHLIYLSSGLPLSLGFPIGVLLAITRE
jgi:hypothetical protein